jgi:putative phage-type endonuclease
MDSRAYFNDLAQGTEEWFALRAGRITASEFSTLLAKGRGNAPSKTRQTYMYKMAGERITGEVQEYYTNAHMERGKAMEQEARLMYELATGLEVQPCGFVAYGSHLGYSPDGLVGEDGLVEIKTKLPHLQLELLLSGEVPNEHMAQLQGGMWVANRQWIDFVSYWPKMPVFIKRVTRDEPYIENLAQEALKFLADLDKIMALVAEL